jgi:hypothetical protein
MDLIPQGDKDYLDSIMNDIHDTFKKLIYSHQDGELTVLTHDPQYSSIYSNHQLGDGINSEIEPIKEQFYGRILHDHKQYLKPVDVGDENSIKLKLSDGQTRIKVDADGKAIVLKSKKIEIDGVLYEIDTSARAHGLFSHNFFTFYLKKVD